MEDQRTFAELGVPFPLYLAPVSTCPDYVGGGLCSICGQQSQHCFNLGIGCYIQTTGQASKDWISTSDDEAICCYTCLREGRAVITNDTECGMVSVQQVGGTSTHGLPGPPNPVSLSQGIQPVVTNNGDWRGYRIDPRDIAELTRTPTYLTWQGERWLFHCGRVMPYIGEWKQIHFNQNSDADGKQLFLSVVVHAYDDAWEFIDGDSAICYMHRCRECNQLRGYWDCD